MHDNGSEKPDVLIVIVCYRVADLTIDCLRSLKNELARVPGARVAICENGSGDDSAQRIADAITSLGIEQSVSLSTVAPNRGFAGGNNFILRQAITGKNVPRHLLLLNADTIVHEGCLRHCLEVMDADPSIGALGCAVLNPDGTPQAMARRFPTPLRALVSSVGLHERMPRLFGWGSREDPSWDRCTTRRDVDWLGGCFLWVRGDLMEQIGVLDEDFGFYGEDIEYCHRVWRSGHRCHYDPTVSITHLGGGANDDQNWSNRTRSIHTWRSRYLVQSKCYGSWAAWLLRSADLGVWFSRWLWFAITNRRDTLKGRATAQVVKILSKPMGSA